MQGYVRGQCIRDGKRFRSWWITNCSCPGRTRRWPRSDGCLLASSVIASPDRLCPSYRDNWTGAASVGLDRCRVGPWLLFLVQFGYSQCSMWRLSQRPNVPSPRAPFSSATFLLSCSQRWILNVILRTTFGYVRALYNARISAAPVQ